MVKVGSFSGSADECGTAYAAHYLREIAGFYSQEFGKYKEDKRFVEGCGRALQRGAPNAAAFINGASRRSLLSAHQHVLLLLHEEELYHRRLRRKSPHCTAIGISDTVGRAFIGQTWDWNTSYYPWSSFNRFRIKGAPAFTTLSFPGLPACAGVNSDGLALFWTGAGYYPPLCPKIGVPTYALVFETLLYSDVSGAVEYLQNTPNAARKGEAHHACFGICVWCVLGGRIFRKGQQAADKSADPFRGRGLLYLLFG